MTDEKIIESCLGGSHQAFSLLVDKYKKFVCSVAYCTTGNFELSEDISQDVFLSVWENLPSLKEPGKLKSWLGTVTRNAAISYVKKHNAFGQNGDIDVDEMADAADTRTDPSDAMVLHEESEMVWQTLEALPCEYREALVLYYRHDNSAKQVAEMLSISHELARQRLARGREMIREEVQRKLETTLQKTSPDKKFTASVIAAISGIPVGIAISQAGVFTTAAAASSPWTASLYTIVSTTAAKIAAAVVILAAIITAGILLSRDKDAHTTAVLNEPNQTTMPQQNQPQMPEAEINLPQQAITAAPQSSTEQIQSQGQQGVVKEGFVPRGVLSGLVTDIKTGEPVIDAEIRLQTPNARSSSLAYTDENGFYYFDTAESFGNSSVSTESKEYIKYRETHGLDLTVNIKHDVKTVLHIQLAKACMLKVEAVDPNGMPVKDVHVIVTDPANGIGADQLNGYQDNRTGKDGKVITGGIKPSSNAYMVTLYHLRRNDTKTSRILSISDYAAINRMIVFDNPDVITSIKVVMEKGMNINGRLLYADGFPASDITISAAPKWWQYSSMPPDFPINDDGSFTLKHLSPGVHDIAILIPDGNKGSSVETISTLSLNEGDYLDFTLPYNSPANLAKLKGKIIIEGDCNVDRFDISGDNGVHRFSKIIELAKNTKEFDFEIDRIVPGTYNITLRDNFNVVKSERLENISIPCENFIQTIKCLKELTISGRVIDKVNRDSINDFKILYHLVNKNSTLKYSTYKWLNFSNADNGSFSIEPKQDGIYNLIIVADNYAPKTIQLDMSKETSFVAELSSGTSLSGLVIDENNNPVYDAKIVPFSVNGICQEYMPLPINDIRVYQNNKMRFVSDINFSTTGKDGNFLLENLAPGIEMFKVLHPDYCTKYVYIELKESFNNAKITLNKGCSIEGYVYDNDGKPRVDLSLVAEYAAPFNIQEENPKTTTDRNGYYKFENLREEFIKISTLQDNEYNGVCNGGILASEGKTLMLDLGEGNNVSGRLFLNGEPLSDVEIGVSSCKGFFTNRIRTEIDGSFVFRGIPEGRRQLSYMPPNERDDWRTITEFNANSLNFDLGDIFINGVDVEIAIDTKNDVSMLYYYLLEKNKRYPRTIILKQISSDKYGINDIEPGEYWLRMSMSGHSSVLSESITIPSTNETFTHKITLPKLRSTIYGKLAEEQRSLAVEKIDKTFYAVMKKHQGGMYELNKMPAGKYNIRNVYSDTVIFTFDLSEGQKLNLDLDKFNIPQYKTTMMLIIPVDSISRTDLTDFYVWLEAKGIEHKSTEFNLVIAPFGEYTLCVSSPGYKDYRQRITMAEEYVGDTPFPTTVVLMEKQ